MKTHSLNLMPKYFDLIKNREKILEGRLNDEKRRLFEVGDQIIFYKEPLKDESVKAIILDKYVFKDFEEMAAKLDCKLLGFKKAKEMIDTYYSIYDREKTLKFGVVIFKIDVIDWKPLLTKNKISKDISKWNLISF